MSDILPIIFKLKHINNDFLNKLPIELISFILSYLHPKYEYILNKINLLNQTLPSEVKSLIYSGRFDTFELQDKYRLYESTFKNTNLIIETRMLHQLLRLSYLLPLKYKISKKYNSTQDEKHHLEHLLQYDYMNIKNGKKYDLTIDKKNSFYYISRTETALTFLIFDYEYKRDDITRHYKSNHPSIKIPTIWFKAKQINPTIKQITEYQKSVKNIILETS